MVDFGSYGKKKCDNSCGPKIIHKSIVNRVFLLVEFMWIFFLLRIKSELNCRQITYVGFCFLGRIIIKLLFKI